MTNGMKTSEFWMAVIGAGLVIANQGLGLGIDEATVSNFANMVIAYIIGRSGVKVLAK